MWQEWGCIVQKTRLRNFDFSDKFFEQIVKQTIQQMDWFDKPGFIVTKDFLHVLLLHDAH